MSYKPDKDSVATNSDSLSIGRGTGNGEIKELKESVDHWLRARGLTYTRRRYRADQEEEEASE